MDASRLIELTELAGKQVANLGRALRHEQGIARSPKRKEAVTKLLTIVETCDSNLAAGLRAFEDEILK